MKNHKLLESKIQIPDVQKDFQKREQILEELQNKDMKLCVLHATIGYGKTVLLTQYVKQEGNPCAWYHLDTMDNEPVTFIRYFVTSLQTAIEGFIFELDPYLSAEEPDLLFLARELILELKDYWQGMPEKKLFLVLDDFQTLENPKILCFLEELLDHAGEYLILLAATRGAVPDFCTKYFMRNQGILLDSSSLSFTEQETEAVLKHFLPEEETQKLAEMIWKNMEGWPAGVMFATLYLRQLGSRTEDVDWVHISQESMVQSYIAYELFKRLPYDIQNFLVRTSVIDELQAELCNAICGISNAGAILKYLFQENIFISHMGGRRGSYRYHSMFRSFLNDRIGEEEKQEIFQIAAQYYMKRQDALTAAKYAAEAADCEFLEAILEKSGRSMLGEGRWMLVEGYLEMLEKSGMELLPEMDLLRALCAFRNDEQEKGKKCLEAACSKDEGYLGYQMLYEGIYEEEGKERIREACALLRRNGRELPPLSEEEKLLAEQFWQGEAGRQEDRKKKLLSISCFGTFRVKNLKTGKEISWRTRKAMELFAYLADLEGRPVERRVLLEHLWQENTPNNAVAMLHNMIYSIRKELVSEPELEQLIQYKERQYYLDVSLIESDLELMKEICRLAEQRDAEKLCRYKDELLRLRGSYLEEIDAAWCMSRRAYFERTFGMACRVLADYLHGMGKKNEELAFWRAYLEMDKYSEEAVTGLLRCYGELGERSQMKKVFESAQKLFREDLGLELGEEAVRIYEEGIRKRR